MCEDRFENSGLRFLYKLIEIISKTSYTYMNNKNRTDLSTVRFIDFFRLDDKN